MICFECLAATTALYTIEVYFWFVLVAVPLLVAGGGGALGVGHLLDSDEIQHGKKFDSSRIEVSGERGRGNLTGRSGNMGNLFL